MRALEHASVNRSAPRSRDATLASRAVSLVFALVAVIACPGCGKRPPREPPPHHAPAPGVSVTLERVTLRTSVWLETHAHLVAAAAGREGPLEGLAKAAGVYERHPDDVRRARGLMAPLAACTTRACAESLFGTSPIGDAFSRAAPEMEARWLSRYEAIDVAARAARAASSVAQLEGLVFALARSLAITWPDRAFVDISAAPVEPVDGEVLAPVLYARGTCFVAMRKESLAARSARTAECLLAYAARGLAHESGLYRAMERHAGEDRAQKAWERLVPFAAAALVLSRGHAHLSVPLRAVESADRPAAEWLRKAWPDRLRGEAIDVFAERAVEALAPP
jgi:hypothetical protein